MESSVGPSRRTTLRAAAWSVPVTTVAATAPAFAVSPTTSTGAVAWRTGSQVGQAPYFGTTASGTHVPVDVMVTSAVRAGTLATASPGPEHLDVLEVDPAAGLDVLTLHLQGDQTNVSMEVGLYFGHPVSNVRIPVSGLAVAGIARDVISLDATSTTISVPPAAAPWLATVSADGRARVEVVRGGGRDGWPLAPETTAMVHIAGPVQSVVITFAPEATTLPETWTPPPASPDPTPPGEPTSLPAYRYPYIPVVQTPSPGMLVSSTFFLGNITFDVTA